MNTSKIRTLTLCLLFSLLPASVANAEWEWQNPLPQGNDLFAVWGTSGSNVYAAGADGTLIHFDGAAWSEKQGFAVDESIVDISGGGDTNILVTKSPVCHWMSSCPLFLIFEAYDPVSNRLTELLRLGGYDQDIRLWSARSGSSIFALENKDSKMLVLYFNGVTVNTAAELADDISPESIWGNSDSDFFVGGSGGIYHYDGDAWTTSYSRADYSFSEFFTSSDDKLFSIGNDTTTPYPYERTIFQYAEGTWQSVAGNISSRILDVWAASENDIYFIGDDSQIYHFNGTDIELIDTGADFSLYDIWGSSKTDIFVVGQWGGMLHFDGLQWRESGSRLAPDCQFRAIWANSASDIYAVGAGTVNSLLHFDGVSWKAVKNSPDFFRMNDIWGGNGIRLYLAGESGEIFAYDGANAVRMTTGTSNHIFALWGFSDNSIFAAGSNGCILHYDGTRWTPMVSNTDNDIFDIWGTSPSNLVAVGADSTILEYDGSTWKVSTDTPIYNQTPKFQLTAIWARNASSIFVAGRYAEHVSAGASNYSTTILRYDGSRWESFGAPAGNKALSAIWGSSENDLFAVGYGDSGTYARGVAFHYDGQSWNELPSPASGELNAVWSDSGRYAYAVGAGSAIFRYSRPDTIPPTAQLMFPDGYPDRYEVNDVITVSFSETMDQTTIDHSAFTVSEGGGAVSGDISVDENTATFTPSEPLERYTTYTVQLTTAPRDQAGNSLAEAQTWQISTGTLQQDDSDDSTCFLSTFF